jgi:putative membrane protein
MFEVQAGHIALKNASAPEVRELAQRIVNDHTKAGDKLKAITGGANEPAKLDSKHQKEIDKLSKLSGNEFDRRYSEMMVSDHKKDIKAFEKEAEHGKDAQVKQFAAETVPVLKDHLSMAKLASDAAKREKTSAAAGAKTAADSSGNPGQSAAGMKRTTQ